MNFVVGDLDFVVVAYVVFFGIDMNLVALWAHCELLECPWVWEIRVTFVISINIGRE